MTLPQSHPSTIPYIVTFTGGIKRRIYGYPLLLLANASSSFPSISLILGDYPWYTPNYLLPFEPRPFMWVRYHLDGIHELVSQLMPLSDMITCKGCSGVELRVGLSQWFHSTNTNQR